MNPQQKKIKNQTCSDRPGPQLSVTPAIRNRLSVTFSNIHPPTRTPMQAAAFVFGPHTVDKLSVAEQKEFPYPRHHLDAWNEQPCKRSTGRPLPLPLTLSYSLKPAFIGGCFVQKMLRLSQLVCHSARINLRMKNPRRLFLFFLPERTQSTQVILSAQSAIIC
jgi:hypothetical protein